jgi:exodeoxyribonuclease III
MKLATFNVNSVRARLPNVLEWLKAVQPDLVCLQEIKVETESFPRAEFEEAGYHCTVHGQKTYNGVAILSREPCDVLSTSLLPDDPQARFIEVHYKGLRCLNIYVPNGNPVDSEKFPYKLRWLDALIARAQVLLREEVPFLITGDFNIIPEPQDCYDVKAWESDALYKPESRGKWRALCNLGLYDAFRALHPSAPKAYTFWDYQAGCWPRDAGIRIDHALLSPQLADKLERCSIDKDPRGAEKASDHTPLIVELAL